MQTRRARSHECCVLQESWGKRSWRGQQGCTGAGACQGQRWGNARSNGGEREARCALLPVARQSSTAESHTGCQAGLEGGSLAQGTGAVTRRSSACLAAPTALRCAPARAEAAAEAQRLIPGRGRPAPADAAAPRAAGSPLRQHGQGHVSVFQSYQNTSS